MNLQEIKKDIENNKAVLVDTRSLSEWEDGHIQNAIFLPFPEVLSQTQFPQLPKDKTIYIHCRSGIRASQAAQHLQKQNFQVISLDEGFEDLMFEGFSTE